MNPKAKADLNAKVARLKRHARGRPLGSGMTAGFAHAVGAEQAAEVTGFQFKALQRMTAETMLALCHPQGFLAGAAERLAELNRPARLEALCRVMRKRIHVLNREVVELRRVKP